MAKARVAPPERAPVLAAHVFDVALVQQLLLVADGGDAVILLGQWWRDGAEQVHLDGLRLDDDGLGVRGGSAGLVVEQVQLDHLRSLRRAVGARHRLFGREAVKAGAEGTE